MASEIGSAYCNLLCVCDRIVFWCAFHLLKIFVRQKRQPSGNTSNGNFNAKSEYNKQNLSNDSKPLQLVENPVKLLELRSLHDEHIVCAALSSDARWLTYSTESVIRLYSLKDVSFLSIIQKSTSAAIIKFIHCYSLRCKKTHPVWRKFLLSQENSNPLTNWNFHQTVLGLSLCLQIERYLFLT